MLIASCKNVRQSSTDHYLPSGKSTGSGKPYKTGRYTFSSIEEGELADLQPSCLIGPVRLVKQRQDPIQ
jgi:hypothetical protein